MSTLELATIQGENTVAVTTAIGALLEARIADVELSVAPSGDWMQQRARLLRGDIDVGWICAATFATLADDAPVELLAAPQWAHRRYGGAPVYCSDLVVRSDHSAESFEQLAGTRWVYNERGALTGYLSVLDELERRGARRGFFAVATEIGTHQRAIDAVLGGRADVAAVDSTLLAYLLARHDELSSGLRVVATLGPFPSPPWTISRHVPAELRTRLRTELVTLHEHEAGRAALARGELARFVSADATDYAPVAELVRRADGVSPV